MRTTWLMGSVAGALVILLVATSVSENIAQQNAWRRVEAVRESLEAVIINIRATADRDTAQAHAWRRRQAALLVGAESTMMRYARIVARDPGQAAFLVGWTRRAFDNTEARP